MLCSVHDTLHNLTEYVLDNGDTEFEGDRSFELVFIGYGLEQDYNNLEVKGKIVMYVNGFPEKSSVKPPSYLVITDEKFKRARSHNAAGAIKIFTLADSAAGFIRAISGFGEERMQLYLPFSNGIDSIIPNAIGMLQESANQLIGINHKSFLRDLETLDKGSPVPTNYQCKIRFAYRSDDVKVQTENVLGLIEGGGNSEEVIILMAHYDHIGTLNVEIYPGANDNASGTAVVMEVANALSKMSKAGIIPDKSILLLLVSAEEKGLLGSKYYVDHPIYPIHKTTAIVNLDMLGRSDFRHKKTDTYSYVDLNDSSGSAMHRICISSNEKLGLDSLILEYGFNGETFAMGSSDHHSFPTSVPHLYYYNGVHQDLHKPTDTAEKIDYQNLTILAKHVLGVVWGLANDTSTH